MGVTSKKGMSRCGALAAKAGPWIPCRFSCQEAAGGRLAGLGRQGRSVAEMNGWGDPARPPPPTRGEVEPGNILSARQKYPCESFALWRVVHSAIQGGVRWRQGKAGSVAPLLPPTLVHRHCI